MESHRLKDFAMWLIILQGMLTYVPEPLWFIIECVYVCVLNCHKLLYADQINFTVI